MKVRKTSSRSNPAKSLVPTSPTLARAAAGPRPYVVLAPAYDHRSAGIRVLHTLCNELNRCGREAYLLLYKFRPEGGADFFIGDSNSNYSPEHTFIPRLPGTDDLDAARVLIADGYTIYPEVLQGNPLSAPRAVRYVLNNPAANGYAMIHGSDDFIVTFCAHYWEQSHHLLPILIDEPWFNEHGTAPTARRTMDCTYVGKGNKFGDCFKIPGTVMLERTWPSDKESLAVMLRNTRYLFTWDLVTQTNLDAIRCGAIPVVLRWAPYTPAVFNLDYGQMPHAEARVVGTDLRIEIDTVAYAAQRESFVAAYRTLAEGVTKRVAALATAIENHFNAKEAPL